MRYKSFELGSHKIRVKYLKKVTEIDEDTGEPGDIFGHADEKKNIMSIAKTIHGGEIAEEVMFHAVHHELVHFILILMGRHDLNQDETFVDQLGGYIAQFNKTKK